MSKLYERSIMWSCLSHAARGKCFSIGWWPWVTQPVSLESGCPPLHSCPPSNETLVQSLTLIMQAESPSTEGLDLPGCTISAHASWATLDFLLLFQFNSSVPCWFLGQFGSFRSILVSSTTQWYLHLFLVKIWNLFASCHLTLLWLRTRDVWM